MIIVAFALLAQNTASSQEIKMPEKPSVFRNKQELINYISRLNKYYGIAGRARFGKRVMPIDGVYESLIDDHDYVHELNLNEY